MLNELFGMDIDLGGGVKKSKQESGKNDYFNDDTEINAYKYNDKKIAEKGV